MHPSVLLFFVVKSTCELILQPALAMQSAGATIVPVPTPGESGKCDVDIYGGDTPFAVPPAKPTWVTKSPYEPSLPAVLSPLCLSRPERKTACNSSLHCFFSPHQGWKGERIFPDSIATYTYEGIPYEVQCFNFVNFTTFCGADEPVCQKFQLVNPFYDDLLRVWPTNAAITIILSNARKMCVLVGPLTHGASLLVKERAF